jgi:hypothetical protein
MNVESAREPVDDLSFDFRAIQSVTKADVRGPFRESSECLRCAERSRTPRWGVIGQADYLATGVCGIVFTEAGDFVPSARERGDDGVEINLGATDLSSAVIYDRNPHALNLLYNKQKTVGVVLRELVAELITTSPRLP